MEHRGTFIAFAWLRTIVLSVAESLQPILRRPKPQPQFWGPQSHNKLDA